MTDSHTFYRICHRNLWGDYGGVLIAGIGMRRGNDSHSRLYDRTAPIVLERTGPFVPAISLPGSNNIVLSNSCKQRISVDFPDIVFREVIKKRIVYSDWEDWDWDDREPEEYPANGEPENYISSQPHDDGISSEMGDLWELPIDFGAHVDTDVKRASWDYDLRVHLNTWNGTHIFTAGKHGSTKGTWLLASADGRKFLETYDEDGFLAFEPCLVK